MVSERAWTPLVTLGLPVYNGEKYVEAAIRGMQAQTWRRLEILISDNASTDRTEVICRRLAAQDPRIRYVRQIHNIGAAANFEYLVRLASGELFAWCAHDDVRLPRFVEACVAELERRPDAVLCNSQIVFLDSDGRVLPDRLDLNYETRSTTRPDRVKRIIGLFGWTEIYGLIRRDALLKALPSEQVWGSDVVLSMKLLMVGEFGKVEEPLFHYRIKDHDPTPQELMTAVLGRSYDRLDPYTQMFQRLARVAIGAADEHRERASMLWVFLEAATDSRQYFWRRILEGEHRMTLRLYEAPLSRRVLEWLEQSIPGHREGRGRGVLSLLLAGAGRVMVVVSDERGLEELARVADALRSHDPKVEVAVLCPESFAVQAAKMSACSEVIVASGHPDGAAEVLQEVRHWRPRLVVWRTFGRDGWVEKVALESGAPVGIVASPERPRARRSLIGGRSDRLRSRWTYVIPSRTDGTELVDFIAGGETRDAGRARKIPVVQEALLRVMHGLLSLKSDAARPLRSLKSALRPAFPRSPSRETAATKDGS